MQIACVLITHFPAKSEMYRYPKLETERFVIVDRNKSGSHVIDYSSRIKHRIRKNMTMQEAISTYPGIRVLNADFHYYHQEHSNIFKNILSVTDNFESPDIGVAYININGLRQMYGGNKNLFNALLSSIPNRLDARIGVANSKFAAYVAALKSGSHNILDVSLQTSYFLNPLPIEFLPISTDIRLRLHRFGFHKIGDIASTEIKYLIAQFGLEGKHIWDICNGKEDNIFVSPHKQKIISEHIDLPLHSNSTKVLCIALDILVGKIFKKLKRRNLHAKNIFIKCSAKNSADWNKVINFKHPGIGDSTIASNTIKRHIEIAKFNSQFEHVTLSISDFIHESGNQLSMFHNPYEKKEHLFNDLIKKNHFYLKETHTIYRVHKIAPLHPVPEMRAVQVAINKSMKDPIKHLYIPEKIFVQEGIHGEPYKIQRRRTWYGIRQIDDFWTFDIWWLQKPIKRSYFRITGDDGKHLTLFRDHIGHDWYQQNY